MRNLFQEKKNLDSDNAYCIDLTINTPLPVKEIFRRYFSLLPVPNSKTKPFSSFKKTEIHFFLFFFLM